MPINPLVICQKGAMEVVKDAFEIQDSVGAVKGKVNISLMTYELLKDDPTFCFELRGKIEAKGIDEKQNSNQHRLKQMLLQVKL